MVHMVHVDCIQYFHLDLHKKTWRSQKKCVYLDINKERKFKQKPNIKNYEKELTI